MTIPVSERPGTVTRYYYDKNGDHIKISGLVPDTVDWVMVKKNVEANRIKNLRLKKAKKRADKLAAKRERKKQTRKGKPRRQQIKKGIPKNKRVVALAKDKAKFFKSHEWARARYQALKGHDGKCALCGRSKSDGIVLNVDHIKPRHKYPHLALDPSNLQVLCNSCNWGKFGDDETDWR